MFKMKNRLVGKKKRWEMRDGKLGPK